MKSWRKMGGAGVFERDQKSREAQAASEKRNWREFGWRGSCQTELREWSGGVGGEWGGRRSRCGLGRGDLALQKPVTHFAKSSSLNCPFLL